MEDSMKLAASAAKEREKKKMPEAVKLSRDEMAARATSVLALRDSKPLQIGSVEKTSLSSIGGSDPVTPAKVVTRKRKTEMQEKLTGISLKKNKAEDIDEEPPVTFFSQVTKPKQLVNMKIRVLMLWYKKLYSQARPKSITFTAIDVQSSVFEVVIPDTLSEKWSPRIEEGNVYILKNVLSSENEKWLNIIETRFQMNVTKDTKCIKYSGEEMTGTSTPPLTKLCDLHLVRTKEAYLRHFVVYVIDVRPLSVRTQKKGDPLRYVEVYVVDQTLYATATVLTIWDNILEGYVDMFGHGFTKPFVLTAIGLKVKEFRGRFTLSASNFTKFSSGPTANPAATALHEWVTTNYHLRMLNEEDLLHNDRLVLLSQPGDLMTIRQVKQATPSTLAMNQVMKFVVHGMILEVDVDNNIHYEACDQCGKSVGDRSNVGQSCVSCGKKPVNFVPRYLLRMRIGDFEDEMKVAAFDRDAQEILYMQVEKALEIRSKKNGIDELRRKVQPSLQSSYTFTLTLTGQNISFLQRSGYTIHMIDWIPRRCLRKNGNGSSGLETFPEKNDSPTMPSKGDDISSEDSYIEVESRSLNAAAVSKSK